MNTRMLRGEEGFQEFADLLDLSKEQRFERARALKESFMPFKVTEFYANLIASQSEPYRTQMTNIVLPPIGEKPFLGRFDPYGNRNVRQDKSFLQHKYPKTLLLHIDDFCISNCQFCYKVREIRHEDKGKDGLDEKVQTALDYLNEHPEVDNVLFTGGDPAAFRKTKDLIGMISPLINSEGIRVVRFATKGLAYDPERFEDPELLDFFYKTNKIDGKQISVISQINHPGEIGEDSRRAVKALQEAGVQIRGQPAVIRGVNDSVETLTDLQRRYVDNQIVAYYLTVFMPVRGVEQYALPLHEAFGNIAESKRNLSGLEKKGIVLTSHDFGKLEISGFIPTPENPRQIVLKWHQAAMPKYLPRELKERIPIRPEDILILDYEKDMYCVDHVFRANGLPYFNSDGELVKNIRKSYEGKVLLPVEQAAWC